MDMKIMSNSIEKQLELSTQFSSEIQDSLIWNE